MAGEMGWRQITEPNKSPITVYSMYQTLKLLKNKLLIKVYIFSGKQQGTTEVSGQENDLHKTELTVVNNIQLKSKNPRFEVGNVQTRK